MKQHFIAQILELPVGERMQLVEAIWDGIAAAPEASPLTPWQREEWDRGLDPPNGAQVAAGGANPWVRLQPDFWDLPVHQAD